MKKKEYKSPITGAPLPRGKQFQAGDNAREAGRRGGLSSGETRRIKRTLRKELEILLNETMTGEDGKRMTIQAGITASLVKQAMEGNVKAYETIRDTIGQKPVDQVEVTTPDFKALDEIDYDQD